MYQKRTLAIKTLTCYFEEAQWISQSLSLTPSLALILTKQDYTTHSICVLLNYFFIVSGKNSSQYTGVYFAVALFLLQMSPHLVDIRMTCLTIFPIPSNI